MEKLENLFKDLSKEFERIRPVLESLEAYQRGKVAGPAASVKVKRKFTPTKMKCPMPECSERFNPFNRGFCAEHKALPVAVKNEAIRLQREGQEQL